MSENFSNTYIWTISTIHEILGEEWTLLPEKAIYWASQKTLILSDLHLGKITHFRKAGLGLPLSVEQENLDRLEHLIEAYRPSTLLVVGDLFHSRKNKMWDTFLSFLEERPLLSMTLVMGNHDILEQRDYRHDQITLCDELEMGPFLFTHHPEAREGLYNICGHIHPGIRLVGQGLQSLRLPCFYFGGKGGILPAFGAFTGLKVMKPQSTDDIYAVADNEVRLVS